ncbi:TetR/AcrR family transcriptional regulator [uncultured Sphingomonas sp.]|uniref:TetR/AcrR family transcriptional regulator n=1 Tax=uncultured Sphingomonas sp. TaxID=158754 RepID=UPI0035CB26EA
MVRTGRPREFDRDQALAAATELFWRHGFEGTSLAQLREAMGGISSASFYAAFKSKEALYREVLAAYLAGHGTVVAPLTDERLRPRDRIEQALRRSARMQTDPAHAPGCFVVLSATIGSPETAELRAITAEVRAGNRRAIAACVQAGVDAGDLPSDADTAALTALFDTLLVGLALQAIDGTPAGALDAAMANALVAWDYARTAQVHGQPRGMKTV